MKGFSYEGQLLRWGALLRIDIRSLFEAEGFNPQT